MIEFSPLNKLWLLDVDGTIVKHNGHLKGGDELLEGVKEFFSTIAKDDKVILLTAREVVYKDELENFLNKNGIRFDQIIYDLPKGERILVNDDKDSGLKTAFAISKKRDEKLNIEYKINQDL